MVMLRSIIASSRTTERKGVTAVSKETTQQLVGRLRNKHIRNSQYQGLWSNPGTAACWRG